MKKLLIFVCAFLLYAAAVNADSELNIWAGYTTFLMNDMNNFLSDSVGTAGNVTKVNSGFMVAADLLYPLQSNPGLVYGPRIEYLSCNQGKASNTLTSIKEDQYVIPLMFGGRYRLLNSGKISLSGELFAGMGLGYARTEIVSTSGTVTTDATKSYTGSGFQMNAGITGSCKISESAEINLEIGYRAANLGSLTTGSSGSGGGGGGGGIYSQSSVKISDSINNPVSGNTVQYDFTGMTANLGIKIRFKTPPVTQ